MSIRDYRHSVNVSSTCSSAHYGIHLAMRIALAYAGRNPTAVELQQRFGMSRATAYRCIAAMKEARGGRRRRRGCWRVWRDGRRNG